LAFSISIGRAMPDRAGARPTTCNADHVPYRVRRRIAC
jgi:hypothetical protein